MRILTQIRNHLANKFLSLLIILSGILITISATLLLIPPAEDIVDIKNNLWNIQIVPQTFNIICKPANKTEFAISSPSPKHNTISNLSYSNNSIKWKYPASNTLVSITLHDDELSININSSDSADFTFPIIDQAQNLKVLILPHREGMYVPLSDKKWRRLLINTELDTTEGLTIPFFGLQLNDYILTYIITNRYNNLITFEDNNNSIKTTFTHTFPTINPNRQYGFIIKLGDNTSPVLPAKAYRKYLIDSNKFVSMKEKLHTTPKATRLLGAIHGYLWGDLRMSYDDVYPGKWKTICDKIIAQSKSNEPTPGKRIKELINPEYWDTLVELTQQEYPSDYHKSTVALGLSEVLSRNDFYSNDYFSEISLPNDFIAPNKNFKSLSPKDIFDINSNLLYACYPTELRQPSKWGYGYSTRMLEMLHSSGIERARLVHDLWDFGMIDYRPEVAILADKFGYLLGAYDGYDTIHDPKYYGTDESWSTAQFNKELFDKAIVVQSNGDKKNGFGDTGGTLNPIAARPFIEERVRRIINATPYNSYFIDCDAFGELVDDYSTLYPMTQEENAQELVSRMKWISNTFNLVIGSEGGSSYAAPVIHVAEGMISSSFFSFSSYSKEADKDSPYYLGNCYPLHAPAIFFRPALVNDDVLYTEYAPQFRLPLNEIVFHDSFVSTNHYASGSLKFSNVKKLAELTSLLYLVPPMYHFNIKEFTKNKATILKHYNFFSPIHKQLGFSQMTDFNWLTPDHLVQKATFDNKLEMIANFGTTNFTYSDVPIPPMSIMARWLTSGKYTIYP